jgi:4-amino-4-deoxy-L-arabinose transferase-like glycosyltransferase
MTTKAGANEPRRKATVALLLAIVLFGASVRLFRIDHQSLWWDEAFSLTLASVPLAEFPEYFTPDRSPGVPRYGWDAPSTRLWEANPPVYFVALRLWSQLFGYGSKPARLLSAVAGVLGLLVLYNLGRSLYDTKTALAATLLLAVSQLGVMYSQEARNYSLLLLLFSTTVALYAAAVARRSLLAWTSFTVSAALMVGTHYFGGVALAGIGVHLALHWRRAPVPFAWLAGSVLFLLATLGPWIVLTLGDQITGAVPEREYRWSVVRWTTPFSTLNRFNNGAMHSLIATMPRWTFIAGGVLFTAPVLLMIVRVLRSSDDDAVVAERYATSLCLLSGALPAAVVMIVGLAGLKYDVRYVLFAIVPYYLLAAAGICRLRPATLSWAVLLVALGYSCFALRANYWSPYKENFRDAAAYVAERARIRDCYAFVPFAGPPRGWTIYMTGPPGATVLTGAQDAEQNACTRTWVLTYERGQEERLPSAWDDWLLHVRSTRKRTEHRTFFWIRVELFERDA